MRHARRSSLFRAAPALLCLHGVVAVAQTPAPDTIARVEVAGPGALQQRREDTAARISVGRTELLQYGDSTLSAALKRQPGISIGGDGQPRLRGLGGGYTQILINGDPAPPGFALDTLAPELIERVDILRSATAEFSAQAIAGTINVILKKTVHTGQTDLKAGLGNDQGRWNPSATVQLADRLAAWSYTLAGTLSRTGYANAPLVDEQIVVPAGPGSARRRIREHYYATVNQASLTPRLNWTLPNGDSLSWQSLADLYRTDNWGRARETTLDGAPTRYPSNNWRSDSHTLALRSDLSWSHQLGPDGKLSAKLGLSHNRRDTHYTFFGTGADDALVRDVLSDAIDDSDTFSGKYLSQLFEGHALALGWDGATIRRGEARRQHDSTPAAPDLYRLDEDYLARVRRLALARSYKAPPTRDLVPRRYTTNNDNGPTNPDAQGNPALRPELAWGGGPGL